jgi:hypothetical protein
MLRSSSIMIIIKHKVVTLYFLEKVEVFKMLMRNEEHKTSLQDLFIKSFNANYQLSLILRDKRIKAKRYIICW